MRSIQFNADGSHIQMSGTISNSILSLRFRKEGPAYSFLFSFYLVFFFLILSSWRFLNILKNSEN